MAILSYTNLLILSSKTNLSFKPYFNYFCLNNNFNNTVIVFSSKIQIARFSEFCPLYLEQYIFLWLFSVLFSYSHLEIPNFEFPSFLLLVAIWLNAYKVHDNFQEFKCLSLEWLCDTLLTQTHTNSLVKGERFVTKWNLNTSTVVAFQWPHLHRRLLKKAGSPMQSS